MFGLRQKLAFGFSGLLAMLLLVSGLSVGVVAQYRTALDRFFYENWRSVEFGQHVVDSLQKLDETARSLPPAATPADLQNAGQTAAAPLADIDASCSAENHNITLEGEDRIAAALTLAWSGQSLQGRQLTTDCYRAAFLGLIDPATPAQQRKMDLEAVHRLSR